MALFVFLQQKKWFSFTSLALESYQLTMFTHSCCAREVFPHKGLQQQQQRRQQQQQQQHMSAQTCSDWTLMSACRALSQKRKRRRRKKVCASVRWSFEMLMVDRTWRRRRRWKKENPKLRHKTTDALRQNDELWTMRSRGSNPGLSRTFISDNLLLESLSTNLENRIKEQNVQEIDWFKISLRFGYLKNWQKLNLPWLIFNVFRAHILFIPSNPIQNP